MPSRSSASGALAVAQRVAGRVSARAVGALAAFGAAVFCAIRAARIGGAGAFVVAGDLWTDRATVPGHIPVLHGGGFDGQFFYRLAADPTTVGMGRVHGIAFDYPVRGGRIGYPAIAWLASLGGRAGLLPLAMIVVNVIAVGVLAWVAAHLAADHGRAPLWGLAIAGYWGFGIVLGRDLAELVAAAAVFAMVLLVGRGRYWWAGAIAVLAVLTREQTVVVVAAVTVGVLLHERRRGSWSAAVSAAAKVAVPGAVCFLAWQNIVAHVTGELPATSSSDANSTWPLHAFPSAIREWFDTWTAHPFSVGSALALGCFVALVVLAATALLSDGARLAWRTRPWELLVVVAGLVVLTCSSSAVLAVPADFRQSYEVAGGSWLLLWGSTGRSRRWVLVVVLPVTVLALGFRCLNL